MKGTWSLLGKILPDLLLVVVFAGQLLSPAARANEQVLKSFISTNYLSGPTGGLIEDADGVLYGTTEGDGTGGGTVFAINPDGSGFKVLQDFGSSANDATNPVGPLVLGVDGSLYGISGGGAKGVGAIFTLRPDGTGYKLLHSFGTIAQDGTSPQAPLVQVADGTLYGATYSGGVSNLGTVFGVRPDGSGYRVLHTFGGSMDGANPQAGLILGKDGALYGTTGSGGTNAGGGTVFKLNPDGSNFSLLHSFNPNVSFAIYRPYGALLQGNDGALYGTTPRGGNSTAGTVFRLNPDGSSYLDIYSFKFSASLQPAVPIGGLVQGLDGSLYGVTGFTGSSRGGSVFKVNPNGTGYAVVHDFGSLTGDGYLPNGPLLLGIDGALYGTTSYGGDYGDGTVFRVTATPNPDPPFVMSIVQLGGGSFNIGFEGVIGTTYRLYSSTNLSDWAIQGTISNETGLVQFLDWNATGSPRRFYKAMSMP